MSHHIGDRVGAMMDADQLTVRMFGYGTYQGREVPPPGVRMMGIELNEMGIENPKIVLDNGQVVWGCECWWGSEETVRSKIGGRTVIEVDIEEERKRAAA